MFSACAGCAATINDRGPLQDSTSQAVPGDIALPAPRAEEGFSIERAMFERRSLKQFSGDSLDMRKISQLLWAARWFVASGSEHYPVELYLLLGRQNGLPAGIYHYLPEAHSLRLWKEGEFLSAMADTALGQMKSGQHGAVLVFAIVSDGKHGSSGLRYATMELGHAAENLALQVGFMGMGSSVVGAFDVAKAQNILGLPNAQRPLYLMPLGTL